MLSLSLQRRLASLVAGCRPPVSHETSWISMVPVCGFNLFHPLGFTMVYGGREKYWGEGIQRRYFMGYNGKNNQNIMDNLMIYPTICDWYIKHIQTYTSWVAAKNNWHVFSNRSPGCFKNKCQCQVSFSFLPDHLTYPWKNDYNDPICDDVPMKTVGFPSICHRGFHSFPSVFHVVFPNSKDTGKAGLCAPSPRRLSTWPRGDSPKSWRCPFSHSWSMDGYSMLFPERS